jgi:hypothetical protein
MKGAMNRAPTEVKNIGFLDSRPRLAG